jgi:AcrR family transcriptional regulator
MERMSSKHTDEHSKQPQEKAGADLKARVIEAASRLFAEEGYQNVSARHIAEQAGCSQMAMYRHFPNKASLITHLCVDLYNRQTIRLNEKLGHIVSPEERLIEAASLTMKMAVENPHYYRLAFLTPLPDANAAQMRAKVAKPAIEFFRGMLRELLPADTPRALLEEKMRTCLACMHGLIVMMISHPDTYGITRRAAAKDFAAALKSIVHG